MNIAVCVPTRSTMCSEFVHSLVQLYVRTVSELSDQDEIGLLMGESTYIHRVRNDLAAEALAHGVSHLFWLDDDMRFPADTLVRLLGRKLPLVGVNYVQRGLPAQPISIDVGGLVGGDLKRLYTEPEDTRVVPVTGMGFGAVLIERRVFEAIPQPWFENYLSPITQKWVGEDVDFCMKAERAGFPPMVDQALSQEIGHVGKFVYTHDHARAVREMEKE